MLDALSQPGDLLSRIIHLRSVVPVLISKSQKTMDVALRKLRYVALKCLKRPALCDSSRFMLQLHLQVQQGDGLDQIGIKPLSHYLSPDASYRGLSK